MILNNVFKHFGLPDKIISDRGPQFASGMFRELMKHLGIQMSLSTAYHPQMDGTTERSNQEIEAYLSIYCTSHPEDWVTKATWEPESVFDHADELAVALPSETGLFTYFIFYSFDSYSPCIGFTLLYLPYLVACLFGLFVGVT